MIDASIPSQSRVTLVEGPMESYGKLLQLKNMLQQGQMGQEQLQAARIQNQQTVQDQQDQQIVRKAYADSKGDLDATYKAVAGKVSPKTMIALHDASIKQREQEAKMTTEEASALALKHGRLADINDTIHDEDTKNAAAQQALTEKLIDSAKAQEVVNTPYTAQLQQSLVSGTDLLRSSAARNALVEQQKKAAHEEKMNPALERTATANATEAENKISLFPFTKREQAAKATTAEAEANLGPKWDENLAQHLLVAGTTEQKARARQFLQGLATQKGREAAAAQNAQMGGAGGGTYSGSMGPTTERNADILKTQPTGIANQIIRMVEGREPLPSGMALKTPYWQGILRIAGEYEPGFDATQWRVRLDTRVDFAKGKAAIQIRSLNTLVKHLGQLWDAADKLDNTGISGGTKVGSWAVNLGKEQFGSEGLKSWDTASTAAAHEMAALLKGASPTDEDVQAQKVVFNRNDPKNAQKTAIKKTLELAFGRMQAVKDQYEGAFKKQKDFKFLTPVAEKIARDKLGVDPNEAEGETTQPQQNATAAAITRMAPAHGTAEDLSKVSTDELLKRLTGAK